MKNKQRRLFINFVILGLVVVPMLIICVTQTAKVRKELDEANAKAIYYAVQTQQLSSDAGLLDSSGKPYPKLFVDNVYHLHPDFWEGDLPKDCAFIIDENGIKAMCNDATFVTVNNDKVEEDIKK